ncbi:hypothetical protein KIN20_003330 [Parelaphostrongylus tenuis]|uniref:Uncharacterized protein n=1 Tax=Parelaphostrongylus tenuis TaxID=148309 RepID=A0AAD5QFZ2_PARTN|nr:hypothetical protein KIN20_003330 [Parelaphostrongylus tenuis]
MAELTKREKSIRKTPDVPQSALEIMVRDYYSDYLKGSVLLPLCEINEDSFAGSPSSSPKIRHVILPGSVYAIE